LLSSSAPEEWSYDYESERKTQSVDSAVLNIAPVFQQNWKTGCSGKGEKMDGTMRIMFMQRARKDLSVEEG
jgi:hypothetical protein